MTAKKYSFLIYVRGIYNKNEQKFCKEKGVPRKIRKESDLIYIAHFLMLRLPTTPIEFTILYVA